MVFGSQYEPEIRKPLRPYHRLVSPKGPGRGWKRSGSELVNRAGFYTCQSGRPRSQFSMAQRSKSIFPKEKVQSFSELYLLSLLIIDLGPYPTQSDDTTTVGKLLVVMIHFYP